MQKNENKPGYKKTKVGWIPKEWDETPLGKICELQAGKFIAASSISEEEGNDFFPCFGGNGLRGYVDSYSHDGDYPLIGRQGALCGNVCWASGKFYATEHAVVATSSNSTNSKWLYYKLGHLNLNKYATGVAQPGLSVQVLKRVITPAPPLPEQEAITEVLECWDKAIRKLERKIEKKRAIKKGLMQQLLSGQKHLPGFSEKWKTVKLGKVLSEKPQYGINAASVPFSKDLPTYLRITDISEDGRFLNDGKTSVDHPDADDFVLKCGDLVFARTGASTGKAFLYSSSHGKLVFAGFLIRISTDRRKLEPSFLKFYTETHEYWKWVNVMSTRSGQPGINGQEYAQLIIPLPSVDEQRAIAKILSAADREIEALEWKLEKWRDQKKFLLNNLVTGTIRLPGFISRRDAETQSK